MINIIIKSTISGRMLSSGIRDVTIASVYSEKTRLKYLIKIIIIIIVNNSQETTVFDGHQRLTSAMKVMSESDGRLQI